MILATITLVFVFILLIVMYIADEENDNLPLYLTSLLVLILAGMAVGSELPSKFIVKHKKKPIMHVECNGSKCDTTYIYKFNQ
jgi:hypothetical protein